MIHRKRKWKELNKPKNNSAKSALLIEIQRSQHTVKCASFGRSVMYVTNQVLEEHQKEEAQRRSDVRTKRETIAQLIATRRGGMKLEYSSVAAMEKKTIQLDAPKLSVADKIRSLKSDARIEEVRPSTAGNRRVSIRENATKDLTTIILKNAHIAKANEKNAMGASGSADTMRSSLRNMKKMDVQDVMNYAPGTAVYYGATIAIQSRHGGFLSFNQASDIRASAHRILPSARFVVWNCDDLNDRGLLRYGDAVWLQAGMHEVLGAQYSGGGPIVANETRKLHPSLINSRKENFFKAQQYGRWIVLNRASPTNTLGERVMHLDNIMLEQEWYFLASQTPYDSYMEKQPIFEGRDTKYDTSLFRPSDECSWKLHLVTLPSDDNFESRFRQYLIQQAGDQLQISMKNRRAKQTTLSGSLNRSLHNQDNRVLETYLPHTRSPDRRQKHYIAKFEKCARQGFSSDGHKKHLLKNVYGADSPVYLIAKEKAFKNVPANIRPQESVATAITALEQIEDEYWDVANRILIDSKSWESLYASLRPYAEIDADKKQEAAFVIQRFFKTISKRWFSWRRVFKRIDREGRRRIFYEKQLKTQLEKQEKERLAKLSRAMSPKGVHTAPSHEVAGNTPRIISRKSSVIVDTDLTPHISRLGSADIEKRPDSAPHLRARLSFTTKRPSTASVHDTSIRPLTRNNSSMSATLTARHLMYGDRSTSISSQRPPPRTRSSQAVRNQQSTTSIFHENNDKDKTCSAQQSVVGRTSLSSQSQVSEFDFSDLYNASRVEDQRCDQLESNSEPQSDHTCAIELADTVPSLNFDADQAPTQTKATKKMIFQQRYKAVRNSLVKTPTRAYGLPRDVFQDPQREVSVNTTLKFLKASSSCPHIYKDIRARKKAAKS